MVVSDEDRRRWQEDIQHRTLVRLAPSRAPAVIEATAEPITPAPPLRHRLLSAVLIGTAFAFFADALYLNSSYWSAAGRTPGQSAALMVAGVLIEITNFIGPAAITALRGPWWRIAATTFWLAMLAMVVIAAAGFSATNLGDSVAERAVALDHAKSAAAQRSEGIAIAAASVDTTRKARDAECAIHGPRCRVWEQSLAVALDTLARTNSLPIPDAPPIASVDPLATAAAAFGIPASVVALVRLAGLTFVFSLASGCLLLWGCALRG